jgi:serine phosphatase RsbU (regulator of sigma subunit)
VGGDYYDFHISLDGILTVVIGDATGHGMKAGTMVTTAKSLFNSYAPNPDIIHSFQEITRCIKEMQFDKLSMCMTMLKIKGNILKISTAGMPSVLVFRKKRNIIDEFLLEGMPLGSISNFPYKVQDTKLDSGDTVLLMSDGLPELQNEDCELYGYQRVKKSFGKIARENPEEIIKHLKNEGVNWVNGKDPDDDVTFLVIKSK